MTFSRSNSCSLSSVDFFGCVCGVCSLRVPAFANFLSNTEVIMVQIYVKCIFLIIFFLEEGRQIPRQIIPPQTLGNNMFL